jgi:hypothetical protein
MIEIPSELFKSIETVIRYQNIILLKQIAEENNWKYTDLKKKYLKPADIKELVDYSNSKKKIKIKKKKKVLKTNELEIECNKYIYMEEEYYVNIKNNNVYKLDKEFVGRMIDGILNFDEEEI